MYADNDREEAFLVGIVNELYKARKKFPTQDKWITLAALTEEVGELNQAILQNQTPLEIYKEAIQVATMAMRVIFDAKEPA